MSAALNPTFDVGEEGRPGALAHEALAQQLTALGVDVLFGLIGDANLFMVDAFVRSGRGRYVPVAHEANAVLAALGYARVSQRTGVATVTHGPAFTNTVSALVEGVRARLPIVLIAGDTAAEDVDNLQNVDQRAVALAAGAGFVQVRNPRTVREDLVRAFRAASHEQRPVVLNVPADYMWQEAGSASPVAASEIPEQAAEPSAEALDKALGALMSSRRPIVLAGRGAASGQAREQLLHLAERIRAPVATTIGAKDLFRGEPYDLGVFGTLSHEAAVNVIADSDCVVAFGAGLNRFTTGDDALLAGKTVIVCDHDPYRVRTGAPGRIYVTGDSVRTARAMLQWLDQGETPPTCFRGQLAANGYSSGPEVHYPGSDAPIRSFIAALDATLPANRVLVTDGGRFLPLTWQGMHVQSPHHLVTTTSFGAIGNGMGYAIGAALARTDLPVVLVAGDGGIMLGGLSEFATAVAQRLDLVVVILNDGGYGAEYVQFERRGMDPRLALQEWPDFAPIARALGAQGATAEDVEELASALAELDGATGPRVIDVKLDPRIVPNAMH